MSTLATPQVAAPPQTGSPPVARPSAVAPAPDPEEVLSARTGVRMTAEQFLALPEDPALDRWLIDGEVWEEPMTVRSVPHSVCENCVGTELRVWLRQHMRGGQVASGESGVRLPGRETALGVDVVLFDAETVASQPPPPVPGEGDDLYPITVWVGVPRLAVEVIEGTDREENVAAKLHEYLDAGVPQVWIARPLFGTLTVHRADAPAATYQGDAVVPGGDDLPGFSARAGDLFGE